MKNLYKVDEYSGRLPNPKCFPIQGGIIIAVKDMPNTFSDGFMMDLLVSEKDRGKLKDKMFWEASFNGISSIIEGLKESKVLLSEPEYIYVTSYITYIVFLPDGEPIAIQVKYYKYFRNRYPKCRFYSRGDRLNAIAIKVNNEVVGGCMPIFLDNNTIVKIKEERE